MGYSDKSLYAHYYGQYLAKTIVKCHFLWPRQRRGHKDMKKKMKIRVGVFNHMGYFDKKNVHTLILTKSMWVGHLAIVRLTLKYIDPKTKILNSLSVPTSYLPMLLPPSLSTFIPTSLPTDRPTDRPTYIHVSMPNHKRKTRKLKKKSKVKHWILKLLIRLYQ